MRPLMRAFDSLKIVTTPRKRPTRRHSPPGWDFRELTDPALVDDPHRFYAVRDPVTGPVLRSTEVPAPGLLRDTYTYGTNFPLAHDINNTGHAIHTRVAADPVAGVARPVGTMLVLPGWGRRELHRESDVCVELARRGVETLMLTLPYHLERAVPGSFSGEFMISGDVVRTARCFQQIVAEARGLTPWLAARSPGLPVGILGISLGGILAHLAMTVERYDFGISMIAGGRSADVTWDSEVTRYIRQDLIRGGIGPELLRTVWAAACPTRFADRCVTRRILMLLGRFDEIVHVDRGEELWRALGRPEVRRYPTAHYSAFFRIGPMVEDIVSFVAATPRPA